MKHSNPVQPKPILTKEPIQKLSDEDLALIAGGRGKEDDEPVGD